MALAVFQEGVEVARDDGELDSGEVDGGKVVRDGGDVAWDGGEADAA